ncbi:hypothetical protein N9N67_12165 [Bacteriovoracaceae bacterium]|nr:hypothetical protein [Bacteriovoracaceae bacterium]
MITKTLPFIFLVSLLLLQNSFGGYCRNNNCSDGTISRSSKIKNGCGQEAVANIISMYCETNMSARMANYFNWDITPGTRAKTIEGYIRNIVGSHSDCNRLLGLRFKLKNYKKYNFLYHLKRTLRKNNFYSIDYTKRGRGTTNPVIVPTLWDNEGHYVTVVDVIHNKYRCEVVVNHWGRQEFIKCNDFLKKAGVRGNRMAWWTRKSTGSYGIFSFH